MTLPLPVVVISALYLFDAALLPVSGGAIDVGLPILTAIYVASVLELSVLLPFLGRRLNVCYKYAFRQFP